MLACVGMQDENAKPGVRKPGPLFASPGAISQCGKCYKSYTYNNFHYVRPGARLFAGRVLCPRPPWELMRIFCGPALPASCRPITGAPEARGAWLDALAGARGLVTGMRGAWAGTHTPGSTRRSRARIRHRADSPGDVPRCARCRARTRALADRPRAPSRRGSWGRVWSLPTLFTGGVDGGVESVVNYFLCY